MEGCFGCTHRNEDDLVSYLEECKRDPTLLQFHLMLHENTIRALTSLDTTNKTPDWSQFFHLLVSVQESILDISNRVVKSIIEGRSDEPDADFASLVSLYFDSSKKILGFPKALRSCITKAKQKRSIIEEALTQSRREEEEDETGSKEAILRRYKNTKEQLEKFMAAEDPVDADFVQLLESMIKEQEGLLQALHKQKQKQSRKLEDARDSRILWNAIFGTAVASIVIIGYVILTLPITPVATAPILTVVFGLASPSLNATKKTRDGWTEYEETVKKRLSSIKKLINTEKNGTKTYLQDIQHLVDGLKTSINDITRNAEIVVRLGTQEETLRTAMERIKDMLNVFNDDIDKLEKHADENFNVIMSERDKVRKLISDHEGSSNGNLSAEERFGIKSSLLKFMEFFKLMG